MDVNRLWAKSKPYGWDDDDPRVESLYLPQHLRDVHDAASQILETTGDSQLQSLGLAPRLWRDRFRRVLLLAAAVHDLGKCGSHFQLMLKGQGRQALRHEWVSLLILDTPGWTSWLVSAVDGEAIDLEIVRWAVAGHHPRYDRTAPPTSNDGPATLHLPLDHQDISETLKWLGSTFSLHGTPSQEPRTVSLTFDPGNAIDALADRHYAAEDLFDDFSSEMRRFVAAVKNSLVSADIAGSALPRLADAQAKRHWLRDVLNQEGLPTSNDYRRITAMRLGRCEPAAVEGKLRRFQKEVGASPARVTFVRAGCGTGKTIAAYWWAANVCAGRRLFVCYPTTGTATAGFADYLMDPELSQAVKTDLIHGRRIVDFRMLQADEDRNESVSRIASLDMWRTPVVSSTVDTVLGLIQNNRRGLCNWPAIAQAGFVFDEIHSYDDKLFDALLHFLATIRGAPILLMTASLQVRRLEAIRSVLAAADDPLAEIPGPETLERVPRYQQRRDVKAKDTKQIDAMIHEEVSQGGKALYVCNTVTDALRTADRLAKLKPFVYHSRFRYRDRVERHKSVVEAFRRKSKSSALAICTQVAEMSLDLSATLLVTALAPVPSLIQRLGRLNRIERPVEPRPFVIVEPLGADGKYSPLPYEEGDLKSSKSWLEAIGDEPCSQRDLADAWERLAEGDSPCAPPRWQSAWLDYGPATPVLELRDGSPTLTVILEEDWPRLCSPDNATALAEVALPMPIRPGDDWQLRDREDRPLEFAGVPVAKADKIDYDPQRGAQWL
ncbi:MAG: CRISPR-associated helicase Cas3' [Pirellulaceae bacterium]